MALSKDLVAASATPLILSILAEGESYGYAIIKRVKKLSKDEIQWADGMLYPVLHRLEQQGLIESKMRDSDTGRKRKYYHLKDKGVGMLKEQKQQWMTVHSILEQLWEKKTCLT
ncbi:MAG: helix-turn-helix transcriptional regulator [Sedimentisphaerales bacterium]|nr:helix-turn-helix transcriptional regulator [Sedimentisphaerales bacterium]